MPRPVPVPAVTPLGLWKYPAPPAILPLRLASAPPPGDQLYREVFIQGIKGEWGESPAVQYGL